MPYPEATPELIARYQRDGYLVVENAVSPEELNALRDVSETLIARREELAYDWDWRQGEELKSRAFRIVQCPVTEKFPWIKTCRMRRWAVEFSTALMGQEMFFWYDQFLGKPPGMGAPTPWHQDEAYWGRRLLDKGITLWMSMHDVDVSNGCMHFAPGAHKIGMIEHCNPPQMASDLLVCELPPGMNWVACPLKAGSVTFHHSKMPHMTTGNQSKAWRQTIAQHFSATDCQSEGEHYHWRVLVNQFTGQRTAVGKS